MKTLFLLPLFLTLASAWQEKPAAPGSEAEEKALSTALAEAGTSPVDFIRAIEKHLERYPDAAQRPQMERALVKAAMDLKDDRRIVLYGERVLSREPGDAQILDRVTRSLLASDSKENAERALKYARRFEQAVEDARKQPPPSRVSQAQFDDEIDRNLNRALVLEARAAGNLGRLDEAAALARRSFDIYPTAEAAREIGRWLARSGKEEEAVRHIADAFTIPDTRNNDAERAKDRARMGELWAKAKGSEKGLGDVILEAYDRTTALVAERRLRLKSADPNAQLTNPMDFTLSSLDGGKLPLATLKGKAVIFDFWATWCGPCRAQHPLYEEVKQRFRDRGDVIFLSVNTDEERDLVAPFLKAQNWQGNVFFEDGLSRALQISSIPTTIVIDKRGEVVSRMNGFLPDRFVDMLSDRIRDALKN
jgi:thiol-disulfide isomerase/thioredoxin